MRLLLFIIWVHCLIPSYGLSGNTLAADSPIISPGLEASYLPTLDNPDDVVSNELKEGMISLFQSGALGRAHAKLIYPVFALGILLSVFLLISRLRGNRINGYLIGLISVMSLYGFKNHLWGVKGFSVYAQYESLFVPLSFILFIGPLLFFYVKSLVTDRFEWKRTYWLHFVPGLLLFLYHSFILLLPRDLGQPLMVSAFDLSFSSAEQVVTVLTSLVYAFYSWMLIKKQPTQHKHMPKRIAWANRLITGISLLMLAWSMLLVMNYWLFDFAMNTIIYNPLMILLAMCIMWLGVEIFASPKQFLLEKPGGIALENSPMTTDEIATYRLQLEALMTHDKLYKDPGLNLVQLASAMNINPRYLSMILNNLIGKNFNDFINFYRVEEIKHLLRKGRNRQVTLEAIAREGGFRSKSTFNTAFKKNTNMTPREFINNTQH